MIIKKDIKTVEDGLNEILAEINFLKDFDPNHIKIDAIGAVEGHLNSLKKVETLEQVLRYFHINPHEYEDISTKIRVFNTVEE